MSNLALLLSVGFFKLVLLAVGIAFLLVWWGMNHWLAYFAYRIHIGPDVFLIAAGIITAITILTVSFQAIKTAVVNPIRYLKGD